MLAITLFLAHLTQPVTHRYAASALSAAQEIYLIGGSEEYSHKQVKQVDVLNPATGKWRIGAELTAPRDFAAMTTIGRCVVFAGGQDLSSGASNRFDLYDLVEQKWLVGQPMPVAVSRAAADVWGLQSVITGGLESRDGRSVNSRVVQMYDRRMSTWSLGPLLPEPRHGHTCTVLGDTVYVVGGEGGEEMRPTSSVIALKSGAKAWARVASLPQPRAFQATVAFEGKLYVFGNRGPAPHPLKYDPKSDRWTEMACPDIESHRTAFAETDGKVYFFGGEGGKVRNRIFDLAKETWLQ